MLKDRKELVEPKSREVGERSSTGWPCTDCWKARSSRAKRRMVAPLKVSLWNREDIFVLPLRDPSPETGSAADLNT